MNHHSPFPVSASRYILIIGDPASVDDKEAEERLREFLNAHRPASELEICVSTGGATPRLFAKYDVHTGLQQIIWFIAQDRLLSAETVYAVA